MSVGGAERGSRERRWLVLAVGLSAALHAALLAALRPGPSVPKGLVYPLKRSAKSRIELVAVREAG